MTHSIGWRVKGLAALTALAMLNACADGSAGDSGAGSSSGASDGGAEAIGVTLITKTSRRSQS